jgi:hypothetical protein
MATIPFPLTAESQEDLRTQFFELMRQLYEDRIGGLMLGDVFIDEGEYLSLNVNSYGGLEKSLNELQIKVKADGGIDTASTGTLVKCKPFGGLDTDTQGIFVMSAGTAGSLEGMQVTIKDATNLYIWGGHIEINGSLWLNNSQITFPTGTLTADTLYYLYVSAPATAIPLAAGNFTLSTTARVYDHAKGAYYKTGDGTKRWLANVHTGAS